MVYDWNFAFQVIEEHGEESSHYQRMIECEIKPRNAPPVTEDMLSGADLSMVMEAELAVVCCCSIWSVRVL